MTAITTLSSMVDEAITIQENGVINFKLLRDLLHSLIEHLQLRGTIVKYEDKLEEGNPDNMFENGKERSVPKNRSNMSKTEDNVKSERRIRLSSHEIIQPEISESIGRLEQKVTDMASKLEAAENLTGQRQLLSRASQEAGSTSFSEALKLISVSKRVDACEDSLQKLAPALEDLAQEASTNTRKFNELAMKLSSLVPGLGNINEWLMVDQNSTENLKTGVEMRKISLSSMQQSGIDNKIIEAFTEMQQNLISMKEEMSDLCSQQKYILSISDTLPVESIVELQNQISELKTKMQKLGSPMTEDSFISEPEKIVLLENQIKEHSSRIDDLYDSVAEQMNQSQGHLTDLEGELAVVLEKINVNTKTEVSDITSLGELYEKIMNLQENMNVLNEMTTKLAAGDEDKETNIHVLLEQIEQIKIMKADKEALEDALLDKADAFTVNRKVSHDQFDAAFEELNRTMEEAQLKLGQQERGWLNALEGIQREISSKIDKIEITPLKEMIDNKIQSIQERIKSMTAKSQEREALGTKKKLLRNLNCISCDMKVVMRTTLNGSSLPRVDSLPTNRSMRPYLTYELDQVRQKNKRLPSRNMIHYENAVAEQRLMEAEPKSDQKENHLCSRYCGGSHTIVTSQQRVTRVGHFPAGVIISGKDTIRSEGNINEIGGKMHSSYPTSRSSKYEAENTFM